MDHQTPPTEAAQRRYQHILSLRTTRLADTPSLGELLLPFLFAAAETCWIDAIFLGLAGVGLFQSQGPLMPLWAPFLFIIGSQWILSQLERRAAATAPAATDNAQKSLPGSPLFILFVAVAMIFVIWLSIYFQRTSFFDPRWLLALFNDILLLDQPAYHIFFIVAIALYLCWRGMRLLHREYEPSQVFNTLRIGMSIIIVVIVIRAGQTSVGSIFNDDVALLLLVPFFLFFCLAAHALARITFERHTHPVGLEGDFAPQERAILAMIGSIAILLLLLAWIVDSIASPSILLVTQQLFAALGVIYDHFVSLLATAIVFLATPLFWLFEWWTSRFPPRLPSIPPGNSRLKNIKPQTHAEQLASIVPFVKVLFPLLVVISAVLLMRWIVRRRRRVQLVANRRGVELHESLWSWALFWTQIRALFLRLFGRFLPDKTQAGESASPEVVEAEPSIRTMRELYRALLTRAASRGYPRKKDETPYEFEQRLNESTPLAQPALAVVTDAYTSTRYGGTVLDESEMAHVRQEWSTLEQHWRSPS